MVDMEISGDSRPTPLDIEVLRILIASADKIVGRDFIARQSGLDSTSARRVDASLVAIRRWLGADVLVTVRRRGWMLTTDGHVAAAAFLRQQVDTSQ